MKTRNIFVLLFTFHICEGSMVKLNNGGYEDVVIAINPAVKEDLKIIENIKGMVKEATGLLFEATDKRLYIQNVKILIPKSWSANNYLRPKTESYDKADIIIAPPTLKYGNDPYTQQYGRCGEPGQFIHFTPNFITDNILVSVYGPRGKVFVHEWAHLRWGVFDEYSSDIPYYIAGNFKVEATRCSVDILGENKIQKCQGSSCRISNCNFDANTGLYEEGCVFIPDPWQSTTESLMYSPALPSVTKFCDDSNHNTEAPNLQNQMCNSRSTWDVIKDSVDIKSTPPNPTLSIPVPTFTLLQFSDRVITLVLDVSENMNVFNRIGRLYQAAEVFLMQVIEVDSYVGLVTYSISATITSQLVQIKSDVEREQLKRLLPTIASGGTNICAGLLAAIQVNQGSSASSSGTEIILVSAGEDDYDTSLCFPHITASGAIIHVIFFGPAEEPRLKEIAKMTGGKTLLVTDKMDAHSLIDAFSSFSASNGYITKQSMQLESAASFLQPAQCVNGTVYIDNALGSDTFFLVTWQTVMPKINLQDPNGIVYTSAEFTSDTASKSSRLAIPGIAESGPWHYRICNTRTSVESVGLVVNSKALDDNVPPVSVNAHMNQDTNQYPNPMVVYASVSQGLMPVTGANVTAIIEPVQGPVVTLELLDNGAGADIIKNDGIYSRYFTQFSVNGRYSLKVHVEHNNKDDDLYVGALSRTVSGGSFVVSDVHTARGPQPDLYRPERIRDLQAQIVNGRIILSWTATGDDLDQGHASSYDLRMNINHSDLRTNFDGSTHINTSALTPSLAGSRETFSFKPENIVIQNGTILYFALVAIDKADQRSDVSNIAQATLLIQH